MNITDLLETSESSDEDYIPEVSNAELPSEEDSDGDEEDPLPGAADVNTPRNRRHKNLTKSKIKLADTPLPVSKTAEKQSTDDLWADFKKDTGFKTRAERQITKETIVPNNKEATTTRTECNDVCKAIARDSPKSMKVTQVYEFAGEEIKVEKNMTIPSVSKMPIKRVAKTGINSILNSIGKKSKINTLEKSKLDWDSFKKEEKIEDELQAYSKSKDGYLEKQDFLQRADLRRFEIEKDIRSNLRTNRNF